MSTIFFGSGYILCKKNRTCEGKRQAELAFYWGNSPVKLEVQNPSGASFPTFPSGGYAHVPEPQMALNISRFTGSSRAPLVRLSRTSPRLPQTSDHRGLHEDGRRVVQRDTRTCPERGHQAMRRRAPRGWERQKNLGPPSSSKRDVEQPIDSINRGVIMP